MMNPRNEMGGVCVDRIQYIGGEETKGSRMESFRQEMIFENILLCIHIAGDK